MNITTQVPNGTKRRSDDDFKSPEKKDRDKGRVKHSKGKDKDKKKFADLVVQLLVPHFKRGRIASKEVFKFLAREMTHVMMADRARKGPEEAYAKVYISRVCNGYGPDRSHGSKIVTGPKILTVVITSQP